MKKFNPIKMTTLFMLFLAVVSLVKVDVFADEFNKLELKEVMSYEDFIDYMETDEYYMVYDGTGKEVEQVKYTYSINVSEPGYIILGDYCTDFFGEFESTIVTSLYTNKLMTNAVERKKENVYLDGDVYKNRRSWFFYVESGTYYLKLAGTVNRTGYYESKNYRQLSYAAFLPMSHLAKIKIDYTDDYSEAIVQIDPLKNNIIRLYVYDGDIDLSEGVYFYKNNSLIDYYDGSYGTEFKDKILSSGWDIKENGTYAVLIQFQNSKYENMPVAIVFEVDKIGQKVQAIETKSIKLSKTKATIKPKEMLQLKVTFKPKNVTDQTVTWKSSNKKVATVDKNGKITAKKKGTCVITAVTSNGKKAKCKITVKK